jgi:hypothetical protein
MVVASALWCGLTHQPFSPVSWWYAFHWWRGANWWVNLCLALSGAVAAILSVAMFVAQIILALRVVFRRRGPQTVYGETGFASRGEMQRGGFRLRK